MSRISTLAVVLTSTLALVSGGAVTASAAPTAPAGETSPATVPATAAEQVDPVDWTPCNPDPSKPDPKIYDCAVYPVPLDYANPSGQKIGIAMLRRRAGDPAKRIGSLFLNPGGPGGSGYLWATTTRFEPKVQERFDLIGFDPRGVARSNPLRCFKTNEEADAVFGRMTGVPVTPTEVRDTLAPPRTTPTPARATRVRSSATCPPSTWCATSTGCARPSATPSSPSPASPTAR
ncbi:hypothetical protein ACF09L_27395 [Streptomyces sp. NPDC014779]|uniref:hypothetical protein n=1 Tax=Streptomyces sp. NPDC014779 TaxID=3364911 RepID=UPI0036FF7528